MGHMSYSLNSSKGGSIGETTIGLIKGYSRILTYSSHVADDNSKANGELGMLTGKATYVFLFWPPCDPLALRRAVPVRSAASAAHLCELSCRFPDVWR